MSSLTLGAADPVAHVINHPTFVTESGWVIWSSAQTNLVLSGLILLFVGFFVAKAVSTGDESQGHLRWITNNRFAHMIEVICGYLRENTVRPLLHERTNKMMPFLWTVFFFILINNLLGLIPLLDLHNLLLGEAGLGLNPEMVAKHQAFIGGTATQSIYVTAGLSMIAGLMINYSGIKELGIAGYIKHLTAGSPIFVWPIIIPIEIMGTFIKPIALAIRLFANMTAGHILVAVQLGFAADGFSSGTIIGIPVGVISGVGVIAIYFLEIFVAFLQAFVFMFLTTVFISLLAHHGEHDHDHAHEGAPAHA
ncbi:MAG: F0F1 ATP synthase subunit A [Phycisphaerales bacterium]|nr:F0F1 ATP synthase subunit A [Phycisphaerales bacterium]